jgi:tetratricopeptide (TPR) repeat protein
VLYTKKGEYHQALINFTKAIDDYHQAITLDPSNVEYYRQRALAYTIMGSIDKAALDLKSAEVNKIKLKNFQNELGLYEFSKGSFEKAINHFNQFIKLNPRLAIGYRNRGATFYQADKLEEAITDYNEAIRLDPTQVDLYQMRATALMFLPAINEAEENAHLIEAQNNLLTALEINPTDAKIYQDLAACYSLMSNLDAALECYKKALELAPHQDRPRLFKNLSSIYFELGEYEQALFNCEKAIQIGYKDGEIYFIQGNCLFETNQIEQAIENYHLAIHAGYNDSIVYFNRAKAYFCLHQLDNALDDATRVLKADPINTECYKLRGLIFLSMHKDMEAYSDFRMALQTNSTDLPINNNQVSRSELKLNNEGTLFQLDNFVTSLDSVLSHKPLIRSQIALNKKSLIEKMSQINFDSFGTGLAIGLMDGGIETLKELGPFLTNLLFHPIETAEELLTAIQFLLSKALEEEWEEVFEAMAPELKELFFTWDKIEDYHKGRLTGLFIGKNGVAALTALGAVKTFSKFKNVIIGNSKIKFYHLLKKTKPEIAPLSTSELSLPLVPKDKEWHFLPYQSSAVIKDNEHALSRIASDLTHNRFALETKAIKKSQELGISVPTWEEFENWILIEQDKSLSINSRGIPLSAAEADLVSAGGKLEVIFDEKQNIVTAVHATKIDKIFVRNLNTKKHIMQPKHAWDKLIKLTGDIEEDCKKVVKLLEDNQIFLEKYRLGPIRKFEDFIRYDQQMTINGYEVRAIFNEYLETEEIFLNDAWIITK